MIGLQFKRLLFKDMTRTKVITGVHITLDRTQSVSWQQEPFLLKGRREEWILEKQTAVPLTASEKQLLLTMRPHPAII